MDSASPSSEKRLWSDEVFEEEQSPSTPQNPSGHVVACGNPACSYVCLCSVAGEEPVPVAETGASAPTTVKETTGAPQAGTPESQDLGKTAGRGAGANRRRGGGRNHSDHLHPQSRDANSKGSNASRAGHGQKGHRAAASSTTGSPVVQADAARRNVGVASTPVVPAASPTTVKEITGATQAGTPESQDLGKTAGKSDRKFPSGNHPCCRDWDNCTLPGCTNIHFDTKAHPSKAGVVIDAEYWRSAQVAKGILPRDPKVGKEVPCEKGTVANCNRYMASHPNGHVCTKKHSCSLDGVEAIYLAPHTWTSNHIKYEEAKRVADEARNCAASANRQVDCLTLDLAATQAQLYAAESVLAGSFGVFRQQ